MNTMQHEQASPDENLRDFPTKYSILLNQYIFRIDTHESLLLSSRAIQTNGMVYLNSSCFLFFSL